ncbi:hypothetical protein ACQ4PT_044232 [Festuca glaucescens]
MALLEELQQLFPSIPLVAEEDSAFLRSPDADAGIIESISSFIARNVSNNGSPLTHDDVLRAIDRGGREAVSFDSKPATYWILDPIDGTKGFLKGNDTLYVAWDHAVGVICVEEAGGQICDWSGKPLDFAADRTGRRIIYPTGGILSTNAALHDKLVEMVSENYK